MALSKLGTTLRARGVHVINVDVYLEIQDLFRFRWDPAILAVVAERPYRFRALLTRLQAQVLEAQIGDHINDNALTRGLHRLQHANHVESTTVKVGRREVPVYTITADGLEQLKTYGAFIDTYQRINATDPTAETRGTEPR